MGRGNFSLHFCERKLRKTWKNKFFNFYRVFQASYGHVEHHEQDFQLYSLSLAKRFGTQGLHVGLETKTKKFLKLVTHLSMKEGSLFCFVVMRSTKLGHFRLCSWCLWKALDDEGCMGLVPWHLDSWCKSSWILNDFFTENYIKS